MMLMAIVHRHPKLAWPMLTISALLLVTGLSVVLA